MQVKTALITGCLGQDASYLTEYLLDMDYRVIGVTKRHSSDALSYGHLSHLRDNKRFNLYHGDITDLVFVNELITKYHIEELYNLCAESHVGYSFQNPLHVFNTNAIGVVNILSTLKNYSPYTRLYQASSSEMWGGIKCPPTGYNELSPFHPRSPYAVSKLSAHWATINYREAYDLFTCCGLLFNHESPRRGLDFVTRKVTSTVARIKFGSHEKLKVGNTEAFRDWGHSKDFIKAMYLMLQQEIPKEYVIATGEAHSVKELIELTFSIAGIKDYERYIEHDILMDRPSDVPYLLGDSSKARKELGWKPSYSFEELILEMYKNDIDLLSKL